jgi:hypothetical protein
MPLELAEDRIRSIVAHLAHLREAHGDAFAAPALVEPNGSYFPDDFSLDPPGIDRLLRRMLAYAPISDEVEIGLGFVESENTGTGGGGCGSGACGTGGGAHGGARTSGAVETDDGYAVLLHVEDVGDPTVLTTAMARSVGRLVLFEADEDVDPRNESALAELTAVASGLGLLLLNGSCVYKKGCGGMRRHQATFLDVEEVALALALFVRVTGAAAGTVKKHLEVTQKEAFDAALGWVDGQPTLIDSLRERPETLSDGVFSFEAKRGLLSRLFRGKSETLGEAAAAPRGGSKRVRTPEEERRLAEARALVEEALSDS